MICYSSALFEDPRPRRTGVRAGFLFGFSCGEALGMLLFYLVLGFLVPPLAIAMPMEQIVSERFGTRFTIAKGPELWVWIRGEEFDLTSAMIRELSLCRQVREEPDPVLLSFESPRIFHRHFSLLATWRCGDRHFRGRIAVDANPKQTLKGKSPGFDFGLHTFSVYEVQSDTEGKQLNCQGLLGGAG